ncbi:MAG: zinc-binding dehydrogenase, partial [SAR324 cluster bacterium]|nr:zinc-binding dehydrogenase [SAR324 cluster bacterium]
IKACAICHSDISYADGIWGGELPAVFGHEASGTILETGNEVAEFSIGDPVIVTLLRHCGSCFFCSSGEAPLCDSHFPLYDQSPISTLGGETLLQGLRTGAFAEEVVVDVSQAASIPENMPFDSASLLSCGVITGAGAVINTAAMQPGSNAVVIGCGGVGLNCLQGAKIVGADPLIAVDLHPDKLQTAMEFGATHAFSSTEEDLSEKIRTLTQGRGADYVFVSVGNIQAMLQGFELLRRAGTLVVAGMTGVGEKLPLEAIDIGDNAVRIMGSKMGSTDLKRDMPQWIRHYQDGKLKLDELITDRYPLERINEAVEAVRKGNVMRNVIVFD